MSEEKKAGRDERRSPCGDPSFVKEMRDMMKKGDILRSDHVSNDGEVLRRRGRAHGTERYL